MNRQDPSTIHDVVISHLRRHFGEIHEFSLQEIVGCLRIHIVPSAASRECILLATSGASVYGESAKYELLVVLPKDWDLRDIDDRHSFWPVDCLRAVADCGARIEPEDTFSYGEADEEKEDIAGFSGFIVLPELNDYGKLVLDNGDVIQFLLLIPLYREEIDLARSRGVYALLSLFRENNIDIVLNANRINVGLLDKRGQ